jgi:hypothetical protein
MNHRFAKSPALPAADLLPFAFAEKNANPEAI